jgi:hypothetical protein
VRRIVVVACLTLAAGVARADSTPNESRWGTFEFGIGQYRPDIDSQFAIKPGPYQTVFGNGNQLTYRLALAKTILFGGLGTLDVGLSAGYLSASGKGQLVSAAGQLAGPSGDKTSLNIVPTSAFIAYRFETLANRYGIPLAPYARFALERYNWWVTSGSGGTVKVGATNGWSAAGGLAFLLDFFDPSAARDLYRSTGIRHTYIFGEVKKIDVNNFGSSSSWNLSNANIAWEGGLMFVF